jgi:PAS domain S-box-containing protein
MPIDAQVYLGKTRFNEELLQRIADATPDLIFAKDLSGRLIFANEATLRMLGKTWEEVDGNADIGRNDTKEDRWALQEKDLRVMAAGLSESVEETFSGADGTKTYLSTRSPLRAKEGAVIGLVNISMDITARKKAEARRRLLMEELNHRVKNTLVIVQAMARQTLKAAPSDRIAWNTFESRLIAMAKAHDILMREDSGGADIRDIVAEALNMHGLQHSAAFEIDGPSAWVDSQTALALAMVLHELGANAIKYGALSRPEGVVQTVWRVEMQDCERFLAFSWRETGGPKVQKPSKAGFGSRLIEEALGRRGTESTRIDYLETGVEFHARIVLPDDTAEQNVAEV